MNGLEIVVKLSLTADEWGLYKEQGREIIARELNHGVADAINNNKGDMRSALREADRILNCYRAYGATDSEPLAVLDRIFNEVYVGRMK